MADRTRFNRFEEESILLKDKYLLSDYKADQNYAEAKARDLFTNLSNPPYILGGLAVSTNTSDNLKLDVTQGVAVTNDFQEINAPSLIGYPLFDSTSGVINYLTLQYDYIEIPASERQTFKDAGTSYNALIQDSYKYQWKLASAINPEQTGTNVGPFDITADFNDKILFSTDQSTPEYNITLTPNVASITSTTFPSGSVELQNGVNDTFQFTVDTFSYNLDLTSSTSEVLTISGLVTRINSRAFSQNGLLVNPIAFVIDGEDRIRITSPRDATPIANKTVTIDGGNALTLLGFTNGDASFELAKRTAQDIADEINIATVPEITASAPSNRVKIFAQEPDGFIEIQSVAHDAYSTLGFTEILIEGAEAIDFNNDIILASVQNISNTATVDTTLRSSTVKLFEIHSGWEHQETLGSLSGEPTDVVITIPNGDYYIVGAHELEVFVNQARSYEGKGFEEIGTAGDRSTQFQVNNVLSFDELLYRIPNSMPANVDQLTVKENGNVISIGTNTLDFGDEFTVTNTASGKAQINLDIISGDALLGSGIVLANHGQYHEYGGPMEIDVTNLQGLLLEPQKTDIRVRDALLYSTTGLNFKGNRFAITNSGSGFINVDLDDKVFVDENGDACVRLGFDGGTVFPSIILQDQLSGLWSVTVSNAGELITEQVFAGSPINVIIESDDSTLYELSIERTLGSGELTSTNVSSGTPLTFSLEAPNGKGYGVRIENDGTIYTLDPENIFKIQDSDGNDIFRIEENGLTYIHQYDTSAPSGTLSYLPPANEASGALNLINTASGMVLAFSNGSAWIELTSDLPNFLPDTITGSTFTVNYDDVIIGNGGSGNTTNFRNDFITLNYGETGSSISSGSGGIIIDRGTSDPARLYYLEGSGWIINPGDPKLIASEDFVLGETTPIIASVDNLSGSVNNSVNNLSGSISNFENVSGSIGRGETRILDNYTDDADGATNIVSPTWLTGKDLPAAASPTTTVFFTALAKSEMNFNLTYRMSTAVASSNVKLDFDVYVNETGPTSFSETIAVADDTSINTVELSNLLQTSFSPTDFVRIVITRDNAVGSNHTGNIGLIQFLVY